MKNKTKKYGDTNDLVLFQTRVNKYPNYSHVTLKFPHVIGFSWCEHCKVTLTDDSRKQYCNDCMEKAEIIMLEEMQYDHEQEVRAMLQEVADYELYQ